MIVPALEDPLGKAALHGLKLVAVAVVAQGLLLMVRRLTPDAPRALIAALSAAIVVTTGSAFVQVLVVVLGGALGLLYLRGGSAFPVASFDLRYGARTGAVLISLFALLLAVAFIVPPNSPPLWSAAAAFYRSGALVFGGGHVVLPLMEQAVVAPGWVSTDEFLAG